jgi:hypothetical protein
VHDSFDDDPAELTPTPTSQTRKQEREGLPPSYRMRAEPHYVEQLSSRRGDKHHPEPPRPAVVTSEAADSEQTERLRAQIFARLGEGLGAIGSASALLAGDASPLARRTNVDLIRAEAWRASWLVSTQQVLDATTHLQLKSRQLGPVLERVRQGFAPECRLSGAVLQLSASDWTAAVAIDETALVAGITGAVLATFGILGRVDGSTIKISADALAGDLRTIEVSQDEVSVASTASLRFFEAGWTDRPGGWLAGVGAVVAKTVAQQHGGNAVLLVGDRRGTVVRLTLARGF